MRASVRLPSSVLTLVALGAASTLLACGGDLSTDPAIGDPSMGPVPAMGVVAEGMGSAQAQNFTAQLRPLNGSVGYRPVHGVANLKVKDGMLTVRVNASGLQPGMVHAQHIHVSDACPGPDADGGDGIVNIVDGLPFYGPVLVGLDGDLTNPAMGPGFPNPGNAGGAITYTVEAPVAVLEALVGGPLDLGNRSVVLHGVSASADLSADPLAAAAPGALPIACGTVDPNDGKS